MNEEGRPSQVVPLRALIISISALSIPVLGQMYFRDSVGSLDVLLWLLALIPAFLLAYYRGWRGVAGALAAGMAALAVTQAMLLATNRSIAWPVLLGVVVLYLGISLGIGWLSELLHRRLRRAENLAMVDELTGLPNRRFARQFLEFEAAAAQRGRRITVVMMDLDNFKAFNSTHGRRAGDEVLATLGRALTQNTRRMNLAARWGGDAFIVILSGTTEAGAFHFVRRVQEVLRSSPNVGGRVTLSAGIAAYGPELNSADALIEAADRLLSRAQAEGQNRALANDLAATTRPIPQGVGSR
jgi:diguanylate cyclase (GGDEF)-like protein